MRSLLSGMERSLNVELSGESLPELFESVHFVSRGSRALRAEMVTYARYVTDVMKSRADYSVGSDIKPLVVLSVFSAIVRGMAWEYAEDKPKVHHWLPVTYLKGFSGSGGKRSHSVRASVPAVVCNRGQLIEVAIKDLAFAHPVKDSVGYYDLAVERFFSLIEGMFASHKGRTATTSVQVSLATFFIVQAVRNPHPTVGFSSGSISSVIGAVLDNLNHLNEIHVNVVSSDRPLPFTPFIPMRIHRNVHGVTIMCLPISSNFAVTVSDLTISDFDSHNMVQRQSRNIINAAMRNNGIIFGVTADDIT